MGIIVILLIVYIIYKNKQDNQNSSYRGGSFRGGSQNRNYYDKEPHFESEWKWDEKRGKWVHPQSKVIEHQPTESTFQQQEPIYQTDDKLEEIDYRNAYEAKNLLTRNEWQNYKILREVAEIKGYIICPKVRLIDIITPRRGEKKYKTLQYKVQSKHVDFVVCDQNMTIKAIIELDDATHDTKTVKERDDFVNMILRSVGYKVIRTRYINHDILDSI